jgi:WD40 repeat protein/transcriptional regulator with XRE-family HTH domain
MVCNDPSGEDVQNNSLNDAKATNSDELAPDPDRIATQLDFGRELTAARLRAGRTVRQVARESGLPISTTGDYFSGRHLPGSGQPEQLIKILQACGETDPESVARWAEALRRAKRSPGRRPSSGDIPYRGLARFEPEDERWFFGREEIADRLANLAVQDAVSRTAGRQAQSSGLPLVLVGPSGSGKSSLLRAGLVPRLGGPVVIVEPSAAPRAALAAGLADLTASGGLTPTVIIDQFEAVFTQCEDEAERRAFIADVYEVASRTLVVLALRADFYAYALRYPELAGALQARQVVLGPMTTEQVRRAIVEPARMARLDVEDGLVELLLRDLAPPSARASRNGRAQPDAAAPSEGDASAYLGSAYEAGALPLLSHALLATWERSRGGVLTTADYLASGGISDALIRTAEEAYGGLPEGEQQLARRLFLRLVHVADDVPPTRAIVRLTDLRDWAASDVEHVLARFVDERLITVDAGTAQITHEALLAAWPRLRSWVETGTEDLRVHRRIEEAARSWKAAGREPAALWRGSQLETARDWVADADNRSSLGSLASEFVSAAVAEEAARDHAERRRTRRLQRLVAALTALTVAVLGLAAYSFDQRQTATAARNDANSREIAIEAGQVRGQDPRLAAQLSVAAYNVAHTPQAAASVIDSTGSPTATQLFDTQATVQWVSVSPDRKVLAVAANDGTLRLWNVASPDHPVPVGTPLANDSKDPLYTAAFSPDGRILAAAGAGQVVQLWNVSDPAHPVRLPSLTGPTNTIYSIAFSPDGKIVAAGSADKTVRLWDIADPARPVPLGRPLSGGAGYVESVAFSPDGQLLAAADAAGTVLLWNVASPARPVLLRELPTDGAQLSSVAFSPDSATLAVGSQDNKVWLWNVDPKGAKPDGTLSGATDWVNTVAFSPDGEQLAAGTSDASVLVWNLATRALTATLPLPLPVTSIGWDGPARLAAGDGDGTVSIWTLPTPVLTAGSLASAVAYSRTGDILAVGGDSVELWNAAARELIASQPLPAGVFVNGLAYSSRGVIAAALSDGMAELWQAGQTLTPLGSPFRVTASGTAETVAFSPGGTLLATGGDDGTLRLWSVADPGKPRQLASVADSHDSVYTVAFAPDGTMLAAASVDDLTRLWRVAGQTRLARLGKPLGGLTNYPIGLAFSPDGKLLAVGSADKTVRLWNVSDPAHAVSAAAPLTGPTSAVWGLAFSPDGKTLAGGITDGTVWLWNLANPAHPALIAALTGPAGHVYSVSFSPAGTQLAAASSDGTVHLWDTSAAEARATVCATAGQPITRQEWKTYVPGVPYRVPCS